MFIKISKCSKNKQNALSQKLTFPRVYIFLVLPILVILGISFCLKVNFVLLDVPLVCQLPELEYGCELTSLTMMLNYKNIKVNKIALSDRVMHDNTQIVASDVNNIYIWGNPAVGYVGDITGKHLGYTINPEPVIELIKEYYDGPIYNLTGTTVKTLKRHLIDGCPIMVWVTYDFTPETKKREWLDEYNNTIIANFNMHCVVLTGFDKNNFYYNDPLRNKKNMSIDKDSFTCSWVVNGKKAVGIR